tara:strand:- start:329 stop:1831 length:1503 start_codon:yes stop_codon:yes gene_type:complete
MNKHIISIFKSFLLISIFYSCNTSIVKEEDKPNFIIFLADDISWDDFGCYGNEFVQTPNIDNLASEGMKFNNMYLTTSSCSPSRNSIMTGRYPHNTGAPELHTEPPLDMISLAEELKKGGYYTVSSGKFHLGDYVRRGFDMIYEERDVNGPGGEDKWVSNLEERPMNKPFFLWYASYDAHRDWGLNEFSGTHEVNKLIPPEYLIDDKPTRLDLANYYDEIKRFDYSIGQVVETLKKQNVFENTFIIIMADNGRPFPHSKTRLNDQGVKTPFIVVYKKGKVFGKTNSLASSIDIAPTILDYANIKIEKNFQGNSFKKLLNNPDKLFRNYVFAEHNWHDYESHQRMVRDKDFMLIENNRNQYPQLGPLDAVNSSSYLSLLKKNELRETTEIQKEIFIAPRPKEEFYDLKNDPFQRKNLINSNAFIGKIDNLREVLNQWKENTGDSEPDQITKNWYKTTPGSLDTRNNLSESIESLKTPFHGIRGESPGASKNASKNNNKGPF